MSDTPNGVVVVELNPGSSIDNVMTTGDIIVASVEKDSNMSNIIIHDCNVDGDGVAKVIAAVMETAGYGQTITANGVKEAQAEAAAEE